MAPTGFLLFVSLFWASANVGAFDLDLTKYVNGLPHTCKSQIYCHGKLLHLVQSEELYPDSKTFVNKKLIKPPHETMHDFKAYMEKHNNSLSKAQLEYFVDSHFEDEENLLPANVPDWRSSPGLFNRITDPVLKRWVQFLNTVWKKVFKYVRESVLEYSDRYSRIYVPNHFAVPDDSFSDMRYWESYWIVRALSLSDMHFSTKGHISNLLYLVSKLGYVPNGMRLYYLNRSQPPLLPRMMYEYYERTRDVEFVRKNIHLLEREFEFWMSKHTMQVKKNNKIYTLATYFAPTKGPRPEAYREDYINAQFFPTETRKQIFYIDVKTAVESAWDFSNRWYLTDKPGNITNIHTSNFIPVELNSYLCGNANYLKELHRVLGNNERGHYYAKVRKQFQEAVEAVLWDEEMGSWFDYDVMNHKLRRHFYPSNITPLWSKCYYEVNSPHIAKKVVKYLRDLNLLAIPGGIPAYLMQSDQQWVPPNAQPPMQHIVIKGLWDTMDADAQNLAYEFAQRWLDHSYALFLETCPVIDECDILQTSKTTDGQGKIQFNFGWTIGTLLDIINLFAKKLKLSKDESNAFITDMHTNEQNIDHHKYSYYFISKLLYPQNCDGCTCPPIPTYPILALRRLFS